VRYRSWGREDISRIRGLAVRWPELSLHPVDGPYRLALALSEDLIYTRLCETDDGDLGGWAMLGAWQLLDMVVAPGPAAHEIETALLRWALDRWAQGPGSRGRHIWALVRESDSARRELLSSVGFVPDSWLLQHFVRPLSSAATATPDDAAPTLPPGFVVRPLAGAAEVPAVASLHRAAFGSELMTDQWRREIIGLEDYRPDLDLVAVAPDGQLAAYCLFWLLGEDAQIEPLATHPRYRGQGLARALIAKGFEILDRLGVRRVHVECYSQNDAGNATYRSAGFEPTHRVLHYVVRF
jgi:mycothiol synthase